MKYILALLITVSAQASLIPNNNLKRYADEKAANMTKAEFNQVLDSLEEVYSKEIEVNENGKLIIKRMWDDATVNASAFKKNGLFYVNAYGGLARYEHITLEAFKLVMCHEMGHLVGGAPTVKPFNHLSSEGQADYFSTLKCYRRMHENEDNVAFIKGKELPESVISKCNLAYSTQKEVVLCKRSALAIKDLMRTLTVLSGHQGELSFDTPDPYVRTFILFNGYPSPQCRVDTLLAGALCANDTREYLDRELYNKGVCSTYREELLGSRPLCWYVPREDK